MSERLETPGDYLRVLQNHKWVVAIPIIVCLVIAAALSIWLPRSYRSSALLFFEEQKVRSVKAVDASGADSAGQEKSDIIQSNISKMRQILYQRELLAQVADEMHLYGFEREKALPGVEEGVVYELRKSAKIEIPKDSKDASFLTVSFADEDPVVARDVTAKLADLFIREIARGKVLIAESSVEFIQQELDKLKSQLEVKEKSLAQFKAMHLGSLPEQMESNQRAVERLESDSTSQSEMEKTLNIRLASIEKAIREYEDPGNEMSPRRVTRDPRLARIKELERSLLSLQALYKESYPDIVTIRNEIKQLQAMTTEDYVGLHPSIEDTDVGSTKAKKKSIDPYKAELQKQREEVLSQLELVHDRKSRIAHDLRKYQDRIEGSSVHQQEVMIAQRDYDNLQRTYQTLLDKKLNMSMAGELERKRQGAQLRVIDPPYIPAWPEKPNILLVMLGGLAFGCVAGVGGAVGMELLRRGFVSAEEVETTLGLPVIATISDFKTVWAAPARQGIRNPYHKELLSLPGLDHETQMAFPVSPVSSVGPELVTLWYPRSVVSEQYRVAATRLELMMGGQGARVVVVESSLMGEGKTSTALNLGHVFSREYGKKTVIVDCDMKRPMVHAVTGTSSSPGLSDLLLGVKEFDECLEYHEQLGIWVMPVGVQHAGSTVLAHMGKLSEVILELRERFQYVVLDAPPLLALAEANLIARVGDIVAFVIRADVTGRDAVNNALKLIDRDRPLAVVLNGIDDRRSPSYYSSMSYYESQTKQLQ